MVHLKFKPVCVGLMMAAAMLFCTAFITSPSKPDVRTIELTGNDQMKFNVTSIEAVPGETIRITLTTVSRLPREAMAHNVVILEKGTDVHEFVNASARDRENDYIAPAYKDRIIAATALAGAGETVEVTFTVPGKAGEYVFVCTFPGHYYAGMKGVLSVKSTLG